MQVANLPPPATPAVTHLAVPQSVAVGAEGGKNGGGGGSHGAPTVTAGCLAAR